MISWTTIIVWSISALLAAGIGWSRYEKKKTRDKLVAELAAMDPDRREKVLSRLNPKLAMEIRQELMSRYGLS
jgi:flagellar motility protein MotE (MotC chaperone)